MELEGGATKAIAEVRLGDRLLVALADGSLGYEEVYLNTHRDGTSAAPFVELTLASGRLLTLSPRHFIPVAVGGGEIWMDRVVRAADEVRAGDRVWSRAADGKMVLDQVVAVRTKVDIGAFNPLTMNGTIVVDGVVASAHSDWFLDGLVSADAQAKVYQAILAPVRRRLSRARPGLDGDADRGCRHRRHGAGIDRSGHRGGMAAARPGAVHGYGRPRHATSRPRRLAVGRPAWRPRSIWSIRRPTSRPRSAPTSLAASGLAPGALMGDLPTATLAALAPERLRDRAVRRERSAPWTTTTRRSGSASPARSTSATG